jgi:hypothetical protein
VEPTLPPTTDSRGPEIGLSTGVLASFSESFGAGRGRLDHRLIEPLESRVGSAPSPPCGGLDRLDQRRGERVPSLRRSRQARPAAGQSASALRTDPAGTAASPPTATRQPARLWPSPGLSTRPATERRRPCLTAPVRVRHSAVGLTTYPTKIRERVPTKPAVISAGSISDGPPGAFAAVISTGQRRSEQVPALQRSRRARSAVGRQVPSLRIQPIGCRRHRGPGDVLRLRPRRLPAAGPGGPGAAAAQLPVARNPDGTASARPSMCAR